MYRLFGSNSESKEPQSPEQSITPEFRQKVVQVFALVGEAIAEATHALLASDRELAKRVVDQDVVIDSLVNEMVLTAEERLFAQDSLSAEVRRELLTLLRILPEVEQRRPRRTHRPTRRPGARRRDVPAKPWSDRANG